jgi:rare lipoprotein A (peptidoglycan hydrolase)
MNLMMGVQRFAFAILRNDTIWYWDTLSQQKINPGNLAGSVKRTILIAISVILFSSTSLIAQDTKQEKEKDNKDKKATTKILYGTASFYSNKFQGRKTANGEIFDQKKMTAACNVLPLGTWIRVTNLRNK